MKRMKKWLGIVLALALAVSLTACGGKDDQSSSSPKASETSASNSTTSTSTSESTSGAAKATGNINVVSREEGSGTRGAFVEITGVEKDKVDQTRPDAAIQNSTDQVITYVSSDAASIGYISLGSLNDTVKALKVNGTEATEENVINDSYALKRPFNIVYKPDTNEATKDFINFIMSAEGQGLAKEAKVIAKDGQAKPYAKSGEMTGKIRISGSTSVTPFMEKLMEAYKKVQPKVEFDFTSNGSGAGIKAAIAGESDLGMASREIKPDELSQGIENKVIALDGIAVVVSKENATEDLSMDQIRQIFTGEIKAWDNL